MFLLLGELLSVFFHREASDFVMSLKTLKCLETDGILINDYLLMPGIDCAR